MVGLLPVTLRAWERRYGLPTPRRGEQGYRLYSEHDVRTLRWLRSQVELGLTIGRAAENLQEMRGRGIDPAYDLPADFDRPVSPERLSQELFSALLRFDDASASGVLQHAFSMYPLDQVLTEVISPALVEIGDGWHQGRISVAAEHFATQFCSRQLMRLLAGSGSAVRPGVIVAACAPGEQHEVGLLMLAVMLRWRGRDVRYLGPNLVIDDLPEVLAPLQPRLLLFSATRPESARALQRLPYLLQKFPTPIPRVIMGGQAFSDSQVPILPYPHLVGPPTSMLRAIEEALDRGE